MEVDGNLLTHVHAVLADIHTGSLRDGTVVVEDVDGLQMVLQTEHMVVDVVSRRYLQTAGTELDVDIVVLDDGDDTAHFRHDDVQALEPRVLHIVGIDTHSRIAHNGLRTRRCHNGVVAFGVLMHHVALILAAHLGLVLRGDVIFEVIEFGVLLFIDNLLVGEGCLGLRIPVDHAHATIDEALAVEVDENVDDTL